MKRFAHIGLLVAATALVPKILAAQEHRVETRASAPNHPTGVTSKVDLRDSFLDGDSQEELEREAGLEIRSHGGLGQPAYVLVRGSSPRQVAVSIDSVPLDVPFGVGTDVGTLLLPGVVSADIYRGAAGISAGATGLNGTLDFRTQTRRSPGWGSHVGALGGSNQTMGLEAGAWLAGTQSQVSLSAQTRASEGDYDFVDAQGQEHQRINNDHRALGAALTASHAFSNLRHVGASFRFSGTERGSAGPAEFQESFSDARVEDTFGLGTLNAKQLNVVQNNYFSMDLQESIDLQVRQNTYLNPNAFSGGGLLQTDSDFWSSGGTINAAVYSSDLETPWKVDLSVRFRHESYQGKEFGEMRSSLERSRSLAETATLAHYMPKDWLELTGTLRANISQGDGGISALLPAFGAALIPTDGFRIVGNVARTLRRPDFDELFLNLESIRGNPDLEPERALVWDFGAELAFAEFQAALTFFQNNTEDMILFLPITSAVTEAQNIDPTRAYGLEARLDWTLAKPIDLELTGTWTRAELAETSDQVPHQPEFSGRVGARLRLDDWIPGNQKASLNAGLSGRSEANLDTFGSIKAPAYATMDAGLAWSPNAWLSIRARGLNLFDRRDLTDSLQAPLPGRTVFVSAQISTEGAL